MSPERLTNHRSIDLQHLRDHLRAPTAVEDVAFVRMKVNRCKIRNSARASFDSSAYALSRSGSTLSFARSEVCSLKVAAQTAELLTAALMDAHERPTLATARNNVAASGSAQVTVSG